MGFLSRLSGKKSINNDRGINNISIGSDTIVFDTENPRLEEIVKCLVGDYVKLWVPKDDSRVVSIFRRGSIGGDGRIGYVPSKYSRVVSNHINKGLEFETEIVEINVDKSRCKIKCILISKEETIAKQAANSEAASARLNAELQKRYIPENSLSIRIQLPKSHKLNEGQELYLEKRSIEYYVQNAMNLHINFVDKNGIVIAQKTNEPQLIRTILRAYFNECSMKFQISSIETPDKYTLNYVEHIEAKVKVSFADGS